MRADRDVASVRRRVGGALAVRASYSLRSARSVAPFARARIDNRPRFVHSRYESVVGFVVLRVFCFSEVIDGSCSGPCRVRAAGVYASLAGAPRGVQRAERESRRYSDDRRDPLADPRAALRVDSRGELPRAEQPGDGHGPRVAGARAATAPRSDRSRAQERRHARGLDFDSARRARTSVRFPAHRRGSRHGESCVGPADDAARHAAAVGVRGGAPGAMDPRARTGDRRG